MEGVTDLDRLGLLGELGEEFVVDASLDEDTSTSATGLAVVPAGRWPVNLCGHSVARHSQDTMCSPVNGLVEVCIVEDDSRTLSAELESDVLEVAPGRCLHNFPADEGRACEGDLLDVRVPTNRLTDSRSISIDEIEDTGGEASFTNHVGGHESGQRSELRGLHDDDVSSGESGANLPAQHQDCKHGRVRTSV